MPTGINWAYPHPGGLQMSLRMGFLNALTPVQGRLLDPKQGRRSESLDPHSGSQEGARGGRGEVLGTAASRVPGGLGRLCSAHLKCIQDTHVFWILFLVLRRLFSMLLLTAAACQPAQGHGAQHPPLLLPAGDFPSSYLQPPPGPPGGSSHGAADFKGGALWSPDRERSSPFFGGCMMSRSTHAPSSRALNWGPRLPSKGISHNIWRRFWLSRLGRGTSST